jgi:hypothetical protein
VSPQNSSSAPVTAVVQRRIRAGAEPRFEELMQGFIGFALKHPGHLSINVMRPSNGSREYTVVDLFASEESRRAFTACPEYLEWRGRLLEVSVDEPTIQEMGGLGGWFTLPDRPHRLPPPKYKMAILVFTKVYPLTQVLPPILRPAIGAWPGWLAGLVIASLIVASLTWVVMPNLTRLFENWLFPDSDPGVQHEHAS